MSPPQTSWPVTSAFSVAAVKAGETLDVVFAVVLGPVGAAGAVVPFGSGSPRPSIGTAGWGLRMIMENWSWNQCPTSGASGIAPVGLLPASGAVQFEGRLGFARLPSSFGISVVSSVPDGVRTLQRGCRDDRMRGPLSEGIGADRGCCAGSGALPSPINGSAPTHRIRLRL